MSWPFTTVFVQPPGLLLLSAARRKRFRSSQEAPPPPPPASGLSHPHRACIPASSRACLCAMRHVHRHKLCTHQERSHASRHLILPRVTVALFSFSPATSPPTIVRGSGWPRVGGASCGQQCKAKTRVQERVGMSLGSASNAACPRYVHMRAPGAFRTFYTVSARYLGASNHLTPLLPFPLPNHTPTGSLRPRRPLQQVCLFLN